MKRFWIVVLFLLPTVAAEAQMSQEQYDRFRHQQYIRQKQRELGWRYPAWYARYQKLRDNPALATSGARRCRPGYLC